MTRTSTTPTSPRAAATPASRRAKRKPPAARWEWMCPARYAPGVSRSAYGYLAAPPFLPLPYLDLPCKEAMVLLHQSPPLSLRAEESPIGISGGIFFYSPARRRCILLSHLHFFLVLSLSATIMTVPLHYDLFLSVSIHGGVNEETRGWPPGLDGPFLFSPLGTVLFFCNYSLAGFCCSFWHS